ncbi:MAG: choice-of-anchor D domain-containing protein, partial [Lentisphaeria bacterium]|nr:choice-of-anchor D domain-containing protein [Lentisphaeria bacterium]
MLVFGMIAALAAATPSIEMRGNGVAIASGDTTPSLADHTDFGPAAVLGAAASRTFTLFNTGTATLTLTGPTPITFSGAHAADFRIGEASAASVPAGGSTTFTVLFAPQAADSRTATLNIASNDPGQNPYTFAIQGTAAFTAEGELPVRGGLLLHLDAGALTGYGNGDPVARWPDLSGLGHDGAPVGTNGTPAYAANAIGGCPAVRFDGNDNNLVLGKLRDTTGGYDLYMVAAGPTAGGDNWQRLVSAWSGYDANDYSGASWQISRPNSSGKPSVFSPQVFRAGASAGYTINNLTFAASSMSVTSNNLDGDIAEIILFDRQLTTTERGKVGTYLEQKYGIAPTTYTHNGTATVRALAVSGLTTGGATLSGMLDSSGNSPAEVRLYYGPSDGGSTVGPWGQTAVVSTGQSGQSLPQSITLTGLPAAATYYARFAANNAAGLVFSGELLSFRTSPPDITVSDCSAYQGGDNPTATFTISLSQPWDSDLSIDYATADGTAQAGQDYESRAGSLVIPAEQLSATVAVPILANHTPGPPKQFTLDVLNNGDASGTCTLHGVFRDYYVAPDGNDANLGTIEAPFSTIEQARDTVANFYQLGVEPAGGITVWLRGGRYEISAQVLFDQTHAATASAPVAYRGYPGEGVRLTGSRRLEAAWFTPVTDADPVWARLDSAAQGQVVKANLTANGITNFGTLLRRGFGKDGVLGALELFVDNQPQQLARWPNGEEFARLATAVSTTQFTYSGTRPERWTQAEAPWAHGYWYHMWADEHMAISGINTATKTVTLDGTHTYGTKTNQP